MAVMIVVTLLAPGAQCRQRPVRSTVMHVQARTGESFEELYRRFKRGMEASGILREYRKKQRFIPEHEARRAKIRSAARKKSRALAKSGGRDR
jgi:ribosomal protein S21